ncbi:MAG: hypothetical protein P8P29_00010 [Flavobacteriaceae bacterium]|nr:hypothetical protein [Flavobacteriaceae bacterium]
MINKLKISEFNGTTIVEGYDRDVLTEDSILKIDSLVTDYKQPDPIPNSSKVYFSKSVVFPRVKFREWVYSKSIKVSRIIEKSNYCIIDTDKITEIVNTLKRKKTYDVYRLIDGRRIIIQEIYLDVYKSIPLLPEIISKETYMLIRHDEVDTIQDILEIATLDDITIMDTVDMINLNGDGQIINAHNVSDLIEMIESSESRHLASELIYNCNYAESAFYCAYILSRHYRKLSTVQSVNRKAFIAYFKSIGILSEYDRPVVQLSVTLTNVDKFIQKFKDLNMYHIVDRKWLYEKVKDIMVKEIETEIISRYPFVGVSTFSIDIHNLNHHDSELKTSFDNTYKE